MRTKKNYGKIRDSKGVTKNLEFSLRLALSSHSLWTGVGPAITLKSPMLRVSCLNVENPENQTYQFWASLPKIQIYHTMRKNLPKTFDLLIFSIY